MDGVQAARGGDVSEVVWKLMGFNERTEEGISLQPDLERKVTNLEKGALAPGISDTPSSRK